MKTKIIAILLVSGILLSFGATKARKNSNNEDLKDVRKVENTKSGNSTGGFVSEDYQK